MNSSAHQHDDVCDDFVLDDCWSLLDLEELKASPVATEQHFGINIDERDTCQSTEG